MQTSTATRTDRDAYEAMVRIEVRNLDWQRENDEGYDAIMATLQRITDLNLRIANMGMGRTTSYGYNGR